MGPIGDTLLVVEDDHALRRLMEQVLVFEGFHVLTAAHGAEALRALNTSTPAVVVLDLVLPWVNGIEVLATMRSDPRLRRVPVLVVTGTPTRERDLRQYGPLTVLHKPFNVEAIPPTIHQLLSGRASS